MVTLTCVGIMLIASRKNMALFMYFFDKAVVSLTNKPLCKNPEEMCVWARTGRRIVTNEQIFQFNR